MKRGLMAWAAVLAMLAMVPVQGAITQYDAAILDGTTGDVLAQGGPWPVGAPSYVLSGIPLGEGLTLVVNGLNDADAVAASGELAGLLITGASPTDLTGMLELVPVAGGVSVRDAAGVELGVIPLLEEAGPIEVAVDIKPGSDRNPFNPQSRGVEKVAILGGPGLDVSQIDVASLTLAGVAPVRAFDGDIETLETGEEIPDGFADLILFFRTQALAATLGEVTRGQVVEMPLEGALVDGTAIAGSDTITVVGKAAPKKPHPAGKKAR